MVIHDDHADDVRSATEHCAAQSTKGAVIAQAIGVIIPQDARAFFRRSVYRLTDQAV